MPALQIRVADSEPIYYYNGARDECIRGHMIGVINPVREPPGAPDARADAPGRARP